MKARCDFGQRAKEKAPQPSATHPVSDCNYVAVWVPGNVDVFRLRLERSGALASFWSKEMKEPDKGVRKANMRSQCSTKATVSEAQSKHNIHA